MRNDHISAPMLRGAMGGAIGALIFFVYLGLMGGMFRVGTGYDQAYLIMFALYFLLPLLFVGALVGTLTGFSVWLFAHRGKTSPRLITRLLVGFVLALFIGALLAFCFGTGDRTPDYWINFTVVILVFGSTVGLLAGAFAGTRRAQPRINGQAGLT